MVVEAADGVAVSGKQTGVTVAASSTWGVPSSSALGYRPFIGDYNGIASTNTFAAMTWTGVAPPAPLNLETDFATATP